MKIGTEVEGRLQGLTTLFCSEYEWNMYRPSVFVVAEQHRAVQIYISDHNNIIDLNDLVRYTNNYVMTVERTKLYETPPDKINVMLVIDSSSFWLLNKNDQIKFSRDLEVFSATVTNLTHTVPSDFSGDIEIE